MEKFYKNGLQFECARCSFCCGHSPGFVYLSKKDLELLCEHFNLSQKEFVEKYCRWADYYGGTKVLSLKEKENFDCFLWENGCSAYNARPIQCRTYPFWSWMVKDEKTWNECAEECPGMNKGKLWTYEEIETQRRQYLGNTPINKDDWEKLNP